MARSWTQIYADFSIFNIRLICFPKGLFFGSQFHGLAAAYQLTFTSHQHLYLVSADLAN